MWKKVEITDELATGQGPEQGKSNKTKVSVRKKSKVPGVMITQFVEELPEGKSTPDFIRKPIALTIQEGKFAFFKAVVTGDPKPQVTWTRAKREMLDLEKFQNKYNAVTGEYTLEIHKVCGEDADTYKCFAVNEFGKAVCTATLNVIEVGFKRCRTMGKEDGGLTNDPAEFRKMLRKRARGEKPEKKEAGDDDKFWEVLLSAERKDYERICAEHGVTDFRWMLRKLGEMRRHREEEQSKYTDYISNLRHIEVKGDSTASFEFDLVLKEPTSRIFLYKDGVMIPYSEDMDMKHNLKQVGKKLVFTINDLRPEGAGLYQADVEEVSVFSTEFKIPPVDFVVRIQEAKAKEGEDALFQCVLSHPLPKVIWMGKNTVLENGEKYRITVSEDNLIHRLVVKNCLPLDKGIYSAVAGIRTCSAWLLVEADMDPSMYGKKKVRKTTQAGSAEVNLEAVAKKQQAKLQKEKEEMVESGDKRKEVKEEPITLGYRGGDGCNRHLSNASLPGCRQSSQIQSDSYEKKYWSHNVGSGGVGPKDAEPEAEESKDFEITSAESKDRFETSRSAFTRSECVGFARPGSKGVRPEGPESKGAGSEDDQPGNDQYIGLGTGASRPDGEFKDSRSEIPGLGGVGSEDFESERVGSGGIVVKSGVSEINGSGSGRLGGAGIIPGIGAGKRSNSCGKDHADNRNKDSAKASLLIADSSIDPGVCISCGLSDVNISTGQPAELTCELSCPKYDGTWYKDGKQLPSTDTMTISKDGALHTLRISSCQEVHAGKYRFEADGCTTEALVTVQDPPKFNPDDLDKFLEPIVVKAGQSATFRIPFSGQDLRRVQWYRDGEELLDDTHVRLEKTPNQRCLHLSKCQRKDGGEIKLRLKNERGVVEAVSRLIVLDKPTNPQGPIEVLENSASCIEIKWKPPKDDGGSPLKGYVLERQQVGRYTWKKVGSMVTVPIYRDTDVDHGKKYRYRIRAVNEEGASEVTETDDLMAGTKAFPGSPDAPRVVSAFKDCVNLSWTAPANTRGSRIVGYNLEKRKKGSNLWTPVNPVEEPIQDRTYAVKDIIAGMEYEFRVLAVSVSGPGEPSVPSEFVCARDPKKLPGKVMDLRVTDSTSTTLSLTWSKPAVEEGFQDEATGYFVEVRSVESTSWERYNSNPITMTSFVVKGLKSMNMYWVRVIAANEAGEGDPQGLDSCTIAMPPPVRPKFTTANMKTFMAVKAGNSVRVSVNFEASPLPDVIWLKDNVPVSKRVTISNADGASQLLIPTSECSDTGVYTVTIKNLVGQETFSIEIRVTDDPKPPGPVDLEENVPGTVTVSWEPSPDEKRDDRLHYMVSKWDSSKGIWHTVADGLFNNKFTVCSLIPGHEYHFRVYAKNDIGLSASSESPPWVTTRKKDKFVVNVRERGARSPWSAPTFLVPLKEHVAQPGYECRMSCAVGGYPAPCVTWRHGDVSLHGDADYYISNTCGVCSMVILRVGPGDAGMYTVTAENAVGRAECSARLTVRE